MLGEKLKYLQDHDWATVWPNISLILFTLIFIIIVIMVIRYKKSDVEKWEQMPLDDNNSASSDIT